MSSVSSSSPNLYAFFQSISSTASAQTQSSTTAGATQTAAPTQGHHHHHHKTDNDADQTNGPDGNDKQLFQQIQSAVTSALQNAHNDPNADPNQIVQNAISSVLQGNADPAASTATPPSATNPAPTPSTSSSSDPRAAFFQTLQSYGVDPKQFHADFLAAVKSHQSGDASSANPFQSFPPGLSVDTAA